MSYVSLVWIWYVSLSFLVGTPYYGELGNLARDGVTVLPLDEDDYLRPQSTINSANNSRDNRWICDVAIVPAGLSTVKFMNLFGSNKKRTYKWIYRRTRRNKNKNKNQNKRKPFRGDVRSCADFWRFLILSCFFFCSAPALLVRITIQTPNIWTCWPAPSGSFKRLFHRRPTPRRIISPAGMTPKAGRKSRKDPKPSLPSPLYLPVSNIRWYVNILANWLW